MAESKNTAEMSPIQAVTKKIRKKFSVKKKRENVSAAEDTALNTSPVSLESPTSTTTADGFLKNLRKSFRRQSKPLPELDATTSSVMQKEKTKDTYNIPTSPLSVMEINGLIENAALKDAYLNILSLEKNKIASEQNEASTAKLGTKDTDLNILYNNLKDKVITIVRESCAQPSCNKELLEQVAGIIQDKEEREGEVKGEVELRGAWRGAIQQGVKETLEKSHLNSNEQNDSRVGEHLEILGKKIVELLEMVKAEILNLYPQSFQVFETYASSCHEFVGENLKMLLGKVTEMKDYNDMLDFVSKHYHSEMILGSPSLQPEMKETTTFTFSDDLLNQMRNSYCDCLQKTLDDSLDSVINAEQEEVWKKKTTPKINDETFLFSEIDTNICEMIEKYVDNTAKVDENLENMVICKCMEVLKNFPKRFKEAFTRQSHPLLGSDLLDCCLWAGYHISYINSFSSLREHVEGYKKKCPGQVEELVIELDGVIDHLRQALLEQFKVEIEPYLGGLMTKNWLSTHTDFHELVNRIDTYSGYKKSMKHPSAQTFANDVHYHVAKGYIAEMLGNKYSCKGKKNVEAAETINTQWTELNKLFSEMGSTLDWLYSLGGHISKIIEQEHEKDIKNVLSPFVEDYPDISKKQMSAILYFRDCGLLKFERSPALQYFNELKRRKDDGKSENTEKHTFFSDIK